ncbi:hydroxyethylthiazole kinase-like uncharacterized protein yjeF [Sphingomonas jejuensis]|uniref:Bifunctional NAD(P)H-hydrate repair enzyme n=1 Tax=Sphingomonas jejuensis TaxID=904715 RepID=A0ABX0XJW9_9SPHN|nr:hydroxyethylthiazole kinase-like uncharacterized protein yjeF [Sphingomonas jejuensis]
MTARPILTAAEMRDAERRSGQPERDMVERAGLALATAIARFTGPLRTLVVAGPGNNGADGMVAARHLAAAGWDVAVAVAGQSRPGSVAAELRADWPGHLADPAAAAPATLVVDALFGTGFARPLDDALMAAVLPLWSAARLRVAADLPSGVDADTGAVLSDLPAAHLTIAFGALKPAHRLQPAAGRCGRVAVADIGVEVGSTLTELPRPRVHPPTAQSHKYSRGMVAVVAGAMPGAAALAASAAARAGAGYVLQLMAGGALDTHPHAIMRRIVSADAVAEQLDDDRIGAVLVGPGLGRDADARRRLDAALLSGKPLVIDGDALALLTPSRLSRHPGSILTPHDGEFRRLFGDLPGSKVDRARAAAARTGCTLLLKGADSVVADPDGRAAILPPASPWLATAGTGDVLAGIVAARRAAGDTPFDAAAAGAWLHADAADRVGPGLIADDLLTHLGPR